MACPPIVTGDQFLLRTLSHIDCQAQLIGSYGYQALGQPGSPASNLVLSLLTLFIAFFGIRLMFGPRVASRDVVFDVIKIGLALTLAFSWPAFRTVIYDVTLKGPYEVTSVIQASSGNGPVAGFAVRLQETDNAIAELTRLGAGRNTGELIDASAPGATFQSAALKDDEAYGSARLLFLAGAVGTLALLRIAAGLLLALAPIVAGLFFFTQSRGIFAGWLKGLVFTFVGSIAATITLSVELAILQPWLSDALRLRRLGYATPSAPIELFSITLAFAAALLFMLWLMAKVTFYRGWLTLPDFPTLSEASAASIPASPSRVAATQVQILRADRISQTIDRSMSREVIQTRERLPQGSAPQTASGATQGAGNPRTPPRLGNSQQRVRQRPSSAAQKRDQGQ